MGEAINLSWASIRALAPALLLACGGGGRATGATASERGDASSGPAARPRGAALSISCGAATQRRFDRGFFLLHNMMYSQARTELEAAIQEDGRCAMLHWGVAMSWFQPLWSGQPTEQALQSGSDAIDRARSLGGGERDRAYIAAAARYYEDWKKKDTTARLKSWEAGQRELASRYPDDVEAQAFWALSLLATADKHDRTYARQSRAAGSLEKLLRLRPEHPGLMHYLIHAYDNPAHAHHGAHMARQYGAVAPRAPHALHMPSHIHVRLGNWDDVIEWNQKSARAAREQPADGRVSRDFLHAMDYLTYGYLQKGDDRRAREAVATIDDPSVQYEPNNGPASYALAATPARYAIERGEWSEAAALPVRHVPYSWDRFPWAEAVTHAARALGAARTGKAKQARRSLAEMERLLLLVESTWWKERIAIDRDVVQAWLAHGAGDAVKAVDLMSAAATREIAAGKDSAEPGHVIGAAEQLGTLLLELKRPREALEAFRTALGDSPGRFNALHGAGMAAEAAGMEAEASAYYADLVARCAGDTTRAAYQHARAYVVRTGQAPSR